MDDHLSLEDPTNPRSLELIGAGNEAVMRRLHGEAFDRDVARLRSIIEDDDKLFVCRLRSGHVYDFHCSADHPRGLWRRLSEGVVPTADADWEPVFDLDAHCERTGAEWAWRGVQEGPKTTRVMMILSDNGSDVAIAREFDLVAKDFVPGGFETPPARQSVAWDGEDALLVSAATDEHHAVRSGWPRTTRLWQRGDTFEDAPVIHELEKDDLQSYAYRVPDTDLRVLGSAHTIQSSSLTIETARPGGKGGTREPVRLPRDAHKAVEERFVVFMTPTDMSPEDGGHPAGSIVVRARSGPAFERAVFTPKARSNATTFWTSRRWTFVSGHDDLVPWLRVLDLDAPDVPLVEVPLSEGTSTLGAFWYAADPDFEDDPRIQVMTQGMLQPPALARYDPRGETLEHMADEADAVAPR